MKFDNIISYTRHRDEAARERRSPGAGSEGDAADVGTSSHSATTTEFTESQAGEMLPKEELPRTQIPQVGWT